MWKEIIKMYSNQKHILNCDHYWKTTDDLDNYLGDIIGITTQDKPPTWGRTYVEVPPIVLYKFGIISSLPLVSYVNYLDKVPFNYCYPGKIFSGDASWFSEYMEIDTETIKQCESYKIIKIALENKNEDKSFLDFFHISKEKWNLIPVQNSEIAEIAKELNKHLK